MRVNGHAIRALRERSGLSCHGLARQLGVAQPTLSNIETGKRNPSPEMAVAIAEALKVPLVAIVADPVEAA